MKGYRYEIFLRNSFNVSNKGDDPAGLASADWFNSSYNENSFNKIKAGLSYAICIYNREFINTKKLNDPDDYEQMDNFLKRSLNISTSEDAMEIIDEYNLFKEHIISLPDNI